MTHLARCSSMSIGSALTAEALIHLTHFASVPKSGSYGQRVAETSP